MTTKKNDILTTNKVAENLPAYSFNFESKELARLTITIAQAEALGARAKLVVCHAIRSVQELGDEELTRNGFKNLADYGRTMFGYSKSNIYDMAAISDKFDVDEEGVIHSIPELRGMGWTGLLALKNVDDEKIREFVANGELTPSTSVRKVKQLVAPKRAKTTKDAKASEPTKATKDAKASEPTKGTEPVKASIRKKDFEVVPFSVTVRDGVITFVCDGNDDVTRFETGNSTSAALAVNMFKSLLGF